ncbi:polysaccharide deacetylase family sporulation protein PdaB [Priestia taiwanensis]|uniref:Chitooligosaccharide deacetylase n=1 Tax=Priestia taiwanensis TaxID=1347902 RepID=A0A917AWZ8_9BACI|nr:polysaccharide deacetylase family sporulation protein PdaB [Priestia taiwanensis]MBM7365078.1 polysaccharide deacetylase family sporulation protein PdaB [Priestia taiwanensis]GGE84442.1 chitooligosaccharide deacetylase [Priestia taiwanensis]
MFIFFVTKLSKVKQITFIIILAFFTAWLLFLQQQPYDSAFSTKSGPKAISRGDEATKKVALTFNLAWGNELAMPILETLKKEKIHNATFFISGAWAERHPEIVKQIVDEGHEVGSMGYAHKNYKELEDAEIRQDLQKAKDVFTKQGLKDIYLFRPPYGEFDKTILKITNDMGYTFIHWSNNSNDENSPGVARIVENVTKRLQNGDIILLHASDVALQTKKALPLLLREIAQQGYNNATISELIANTELKRKEVK